MPKEYGGLVVHKQTRSSGPLMLPYEFYGSWVQL